MAVAEAEWEEACRGLMRAALDRAWVDGALAAGVRRQARQGQSRGKVGQSSPGRGSVPPRTQLRQLLAQGKHSRGVSRSLPCCIPGRRLELSMPAASAGRTVAAHRRSAASTIFVHVSFYLAVSTTDSHLLSELYSVALFVTRQRVARRNRPADKLGAPLPEGARLPRSVKVTGLAQKLGQLEAVTREFQSKYWANLQLLGQPCNFYAPPQVAMCDPRKGRRTSRGD